MKKLIFTLLTGLFISISAFAQNYTVTIYGNVMMVVQNSIIPVPNQAVTISIDSIGYGFTYQNTVYTDDSGYYEDIVEIPGFAGYAFVQAMTYDSCLGQNQYNSVVIVPGTTLPSMDFYLCNSTPPDCQASFYYYQTNPADPYTFKFENVSIGNYSEVFWDFGDSTFSTEVSPVHTFTGPGTYSVCLTISDGTICTSTYCDFVYTGGNTSECENYFLYNYSNNDPYTLAFEGFLLNGQYAQYYSWDFGDGTYGNGQTVTHTYNPQGIAFYMVGLTTIVYDPVTMDSCFYTSYQEVWFQNYPGCNAYFTYYPDSLDQTTINFMDMSYSANGIPPDSWSWEFGDGTSSALQNPVHTYADTGYYSVCLTIYAADSCSNTYCEEIYTGYAPPPSGCESFILPMNMYGLTIDFEGYTVSPFETQYTWEFGDGVTGTGQIVSHTYPSAGMYNVTLQTVDATGCYFQTFTQIWLDTLNQGGCTAMFTYEQADSNTFTFNGMVYQNNGGIYPDSTGTYFWDFGDGTTGTGQTITHYFQENPAGGYNVCLTATMVMPDGYCTSVYCEYISFVIPSFNIFGHVYLENNLAADQAVIHLMSMDSTYQGVIEVQFTTIDSGGFYSFNNLPLYNGRMYYVQAELAEGSVYFGDYLPTYHMSALNWESANPILPLNNWPADVFMTAGSPVEGGNGSITGVVSDLGARGGFLNDVEVVLMDGDKTPLIYSRSGEMGNFTFENLALGTYVIHAEMMGIHTIQAEITLSEQQPAASVEVQVSGGEANVVFGLKEPGINLEEVSEIYPNPVTGNAKIDVTVKKESSVEINIFGMTGQLMDAEAMILGAGMHNLNLELGSLPEGIYMIRIMSGQGDVVTRRLIKSR